MARTTRKPRRRSRLTLKTWEQMEAIISPIRQDIVNSITAIGPCSISEIAREVGKPPDAIYYHVRKLLAVGLLLHVRSRATRRREEAVYDVLAEKLELCYDLTDPVIAGSLQRIATSMLRRASRHISAATDLESTEPNGPCRNFRMMGGLAWLSKDDLREVNRHLDAALKIMARPRSGPDQQLCSFTGALSPVEVLVRRGEEED